MAKPGLRQAMAGLHVWVGVLAGWLLYAIFVTGGISFFRQELSQWMRPEIAAASPQDDAVVVQRALATLSQVAAGSDKWVLTLPGPRSNAVELEWENGGRHQRALLDPATGKQVVARDTLAGEFFYYFHFSLHYLPRMTGRWLVGLCAMMALVAMVSGLIVHRRLFSDFFTFRPGRANRSWLDAHNGLSVLALPFHLMIVYTGLVTLMFTYMPWGAQAVYGEQARPALASIMQVRPDTPARSGIAHPLTALPPILQQASRRWGDATVSQIVISHPGDANARVAIVRGARDRLSVAPAYLLFDGASGALLAAHDGASPAITAWGVAYGLHVGRFADPYLRFMLLLCSLAGAAMVATGMLLWVLKRQHRWPPRVLLLVERGNLACIAGLLAAVPAFLLANRLLPLDLAQRSNREIDCFFACWGIALLHAAWRKPTTAWREQVTAAALLWLALPAVNAALTSRGLYRSWLAGDWVFVACDTLFALTGAVLLLVAARLGRD
ncbi:PepSY-associated TM helix domain-containing protein [Herbaspirillum sp. alder98]|uniref:PepSY-associated TM helix domain-containing protein n=1 Tax=Herbaspirillum sp. alder98 TaxID=2913096 RepID=UPI001CD8F35E|nr:PepSY-associated TM helix domain-containing protein [Herbaspirillum sp. alder98]MCA1323670.1 PepSY domain-containing protein [Herbaspirillum sp. alder98]